MAEEGERDNLHSAASVEEEGRVHPHGGPPDPIASTGEEESADVVPSAQFEEERAGIEEEAAAASREVEFHPLKSNRVADVEEALRMEKIGDIEEESGIACDKGESPLTVGEDEAGTVNDFQENPVSSTDLPLQESRGDGEEAAARSEHGDENAEEEELVGILSELSPYQQHRTTIRGLDCGGEGTSGNGNGRACFPEEEVDGETGSLPITLTDLPPSIMKAVRVLECESDAPEGLCHVYLVGTAHVSQESCKEVQAVIRHLKPQVVFLELCKNRVSMLMPQSLQVPTVKEMVEMFKSRRMNLFGILYSWFLAKVANELEVFPGSEFRVAYEEALACGAKVSLGDRDVQMKDMENMDMVTLMVQEMSKSFPSLMETLVHERDMYMAAMLQKIAQHSSLVVAVVGKGHLTGIANNWNAVIPVEALLEIPQKKKKTTKGYMQTCFLTLAVGGIAVASGLYIRSRC